ncbi:MAG: class I SAM-dependent methyltransferase [Bdellovibrionales bacterium]
MLFSWREWLGNWRKPTVETVLHQKILDTIQAGGPLSVEAYMQMALHDPEHGYYRQGVPVGLEGDFSTAPEHSQMFGEMIGLWCFEMWRKAQSPSPFLLLELGPGRGTMMKSLLSATSAQKEWHQAMRLHLMESSQTLRAMQKERLDVYAPVYIDKIADLPPLPLFVVANEFFDTFPMRQCVYRKGKWRERLVGLKRGSLSFVEGEALDFAPDILEREKIQEGWVFETSPISQQLISELAVHIAHHGGAGLFIDYGYEKPTGESSLFALHQHKHTDIFLKPGQTDVTGDVDFSAFRRVLSGQSLSVWGPIGQGDFFQQLGIQVRAHQLRQHSPDFADKIDQELFRLIHPSVMGTWFKVLGFASPELKQMGFAAADRK